MRQVMDRKFIHSFLEQHELHHTFPKALQERTRLYHFEKGETICTEGEQLNQMYLLVKGKLKIYTVSTEGRSRLLRFKNPLDIVGDVEYLKKNLVFNTVEAVTEGALLGISYEDITRIAYDHPPFLQFLLEEVTHKFYTESNASTLNHLNSVETRLASYFLSTATTEKSTLFYQEMKTTNLKDIADLIGTSYRHLNRVIKQMCEEGIIEKKSKRIYIKNHDLLRERAHGNIYE